MPLGPRRVRKTTDDIRSATTFSKSRLSVPMIGHEALLWGLAIFGSLLVGAAKAGLPALGLLSVPLLSLAMPPMQAAALLLPVYMFSDIVAVWIYRHHYSARLIAILFPAALIGIAVGWILFDSTDDDTVRLVVGLIGLAFVAFRIRRRFGEPRAATPSSLPLGIFWGAVSGFTSFVAHAGGPAFQIYTLPQKLPKLVFVGTSTFLFALINLAKVPAYISLGLMHFQQLADVALLFPVAALGAIIGYRLTNILPEKLFFSLVEVVLLVVSTALVLQGLEG